ncbi:MAG: hypothetical protein J6333_02630, partial [Planctomycetes bacterium]|nr:hypothetical protein [Planctomycetota bacterium]
MGMAIGICGTPRQAARYRRDGFDFYEATVRELCCPLADEAEFARRWRAADDGSLPCAGARGLLPPGLKICGPV